MIPYINLSTSCGKQITLPLVINSPAKGKMAQRKEWRQISESKHAWDALILTRMHSSKHKRPVAANLVCTLRKLDVKIQAEYHVYTLQKHYLRWIISWIIWTSKSSNRNIPELDTEQKESNDGKWEKLRIDHQNRYATSKSLRKEVASK